MTPTPTAPVGRRIPDWRAAVGLLRAVLAALRQRLLAFLGLVALLMVVGGSVRGTPEMALVLLAFVVVAAVVWEVAENRGRDAGRRERVP